MKKGNRTLIIVTALLIASGLSCKPSGGEQSGPDRTEKEKVIEVNLEAEDHTGSSGTFEIRSMDSGEDLVVIPDGGWLAFDVPISAPGRYKAQVHLLSDSTNGTALWIEDYYDNKDDRQYNITGSMMAPAGETRDKLITIHKDGSPLNKGLHKMKLHATGGEVTVDRISFTLMKKHRDTPQILKQNTNGEKWVVAWADEFEVDGLPDSTKWTYDIGNWGWGNNELQYYTEGRSENARIEDGNLIIEAHKDDLGEKWTSARLTTRGKTSFIYGKMEFRAKVPVKRGNWAAGWTLGDAYVDEISWPYCGEIDIMESVGFELDDQTGDGLAHASVHCGAYYFKLNNQPTAITDVKNMNSQFHTYAVEWTPEYMKAYVDDVHYFTYEDTSDSLTWPFDEPQNIILNLAMGGGWGGARGMDENVSIQTIVIDYVRVYELK